MIHNINHNTAKIRVLIEEQLKEWDIPGTAISIIKNGEVIFREGIGLRNISKNLNVTPDTIFPIASVTKSFTSAALAILEDEKKLNWDEPLKNYLPEFDLIDSYIGSRVTSRDILCHRTGLPRHDMILENLDYRRCDIHSRVKHLELSKTFRTHWQYNNHMYVIAGHLVEVLTGMKWEDFVKSRLLDLLDMKSSSFTVEDIKKSSNYALPYAEVKGINTEVPFYNISESGPAGSINSSIVDMEKWIILHMNGGKYKGSQIVSQKNINEMHTSNMIIRDGMPFRFNEMPNASYGLGWFIQPYRGFNHIYHGGVIDGFGSLAAIIPDEDLGIVILTNKGGSGLFNRMICYSLFDILLELDIIPWNQRFMDILDKNKRTEKAQMEKISSTYNEIVESSGSLKDYTGSFKNPGYGNIEINSFDNKLQLTYANKGIPIQHYKNNIFLPCTSGENNLLIQIKFNIDRFGNIESLAIPFESNTKDIVFTRVNTI